MAGSGVESGEEEVLLQRIGLARNEAVVFLALYSLGQSGANDVSKKTGIQRTLVYDTLKRLVEKGFVSDTDVDKKKLFTAVDAAGLKTLVENRNDEVLDNASRLAGFLKKKRVIASEPVVRVFHGREGIKAILADSVETMPTGGVIRAFALNRELLSLIPVVLKWWHKKRIAKKIVFKASMDKQTWSLERGKELSRMAFTQVGFLDAVFVTPTTYHIYGSKIALINAGKGQLLGILIESEAFASAFRTLFEHTWKQSTSSVRRASEFS